ncbi:MAG: PQQ-binding-like beta-propeller repeat protein [Acidisphaera sp.]|nr:PQQ-binding-like beta-propeller repeat protein [Acidisphaera sp.]
MARPASRGGALTRRAALLLPLAALGGCGLFDNLFGSNKRPLPGKREDVMPAHAGLTVPSGAAHIVLPPAVANADWPQPGGNPAHVMGHLASGDRLAQAWQADIGEGGGYRRKITAQPVVAGGRVYAMDSSAVVTAFDARNGASVWRFNTRARHDRSTNVGGGVAFDGGVLYVSTGRGEALALDAATGALKWRQPLGAPGRSSPTVAGGRLYLTTIEGKLLALAVGDGKRLWSFQAAHAETTVLGEPAPAFADGLVVAGFGSGDLAALRADTGAVAWTDSVAAAEGRSSLADLSAITGMPVIDNGRVYVLGLGGLLVSLDLHAGRRLWEREVAGGQTPYVAGDWLFLVTTDQQIAAVDVRDGQAAWLADLPRYQNPKRQSGPLEWFGPVLVGDRLVVAGTNRSALAVSPYTGQVLGEQRLPAPAAVAPVAAGGTVYLVTNDGSLLALR